MSATAESAANDTIRSFEIEMTQARTTHAPLIAELEAELIGVSYEESDAFREFTDDVFSNLGAEAANQCESSSDQDAAIGRVESFVSSTIAADAMSLVVACVSFNGPEQGAALINRMVSESPLRVEFGAGR